MKEKLEKLLENSYSNYSNYRVSCICIMKDGNEFTGVNIENASYGATICAERVAIFKAVSEGYRQGDFKELHVMVDSIKIASPCFMCRQVITEFFSDDAIVTMYAKNTTKTVSVSELCPYPFTEDNL